MVKDGIEVAEYLTSVLRQPRILLIGHSWGSVLAIHMLRRRPDLFWAYVGTGQVVNMRRNEEHNYQRLLARAEQFEDGETLQIIRALGPPPYPDRSKLKTLLEWSDKLADGDGDPVQPRPTPPGTDFTADDVPALMQGMQFSRNQLFEELSALDLASLGLDFKMPMFFFHGTADPVAPLELAEQYFQTISAPHKELVRFEGCHHFLVFNRPQDFLRKLVERVYPYLGLQ
jgi:pimeloyl-ACP methyl ester carboxylesterase